MAVGRDYLQEVQKFTSSQYWYSGWRITAGVMVPLLVFILTGWLAVAVPFLWGALFVSLTDTPGPIHHRRNGMIAAILLNTSVVLLTTITKEYQALLVIQIVVLGFFLTMLGIYGGRAGAVGTLALVVMLLNLLSINEEYNTLQGSLLIGAGGCWYMLFSMMLHGIRPYRPAEQALGEHLIAIAGYIRARATFYREGADLTQCFHRVMKEQSEVREIQTQTQELLFATRRFVGDASPRSRALMMIFLDSLDLFEETMYSYRDYDDIQKSLDTSGLLNKYYGLILELAAGVEYIGIAIQGGTLTCFYLNGVARSCSALFVGRAVRKSHRYAGAHPPQAQWNDCGNPPQHKRCLTHNDHKRISGAARHPDSGPGIFSDDAWYLRRPRGCSGNTCPRRHASEFIVHQ